MIIRHDEGDLERVYSCGDNDLGVNAINHDCKFATECCYPLSEFNLKEWEIVE